MYIMTPSVHGSTVSAKVAFSDQSLPTAETVYTVRGKAAFGFPYIFSSSFSGHIYIPSGKSGAKLHSASYLLEIVAGNDIPSKYITIS